MSDDSQPTEIESDGVPTEEESTPSVLDWNRERRKRGLASVPVPEEIVEGARLIPIEDRERACKHDRVSVDIHTRKVLCQACRVDLDPVAVLMQYAVRERTFYQYTANYKAQRKELSEEVESLKRQKKNLQSQVARDEIMKRQRELEKRMHEVAREANDYKYRYEEAVKQLQELGKKPKA